MTLSGEGDGIATSACFPPILTLRQSLCWMSLVAIISHSITNLWWLFNSSGLLGSAYNRSPLKAERWFDDKLFYSWTFQTILDLSLKDLGEAAWKDPTGCSCRVEMLQGKESRGIQTNPAHYPTACWWSLPRLILQH